MIATGIAPGTAADTWRIEPLFASAGRKHHLRGGALPPPLAARYGADLAIGPRPDRPTIVSNFVTTLDGGVAPRLPLVEGIGYSIGAAPWAEFASVTRAGSHLFLRYRLQEPARHPGGHA